jgi:hypothetical protein
MTDCINLLHLEEHLNKSVKKLQKIKDIIESKNKQIDHLTLLLKTEKVKNNIFMKIIENHTNFKLDDIYQEKEDGLHIYKYDNASIPLILHDSTNEDTREYNISNKPKKTFRTFKTIDLVSEKPQEQEDQLKKVEEERKEILQTNSFDISIKETYKNIENIFSDISKNRIYKKNIISIKDYRIKLLGHLSLPDYIKLIQTHIQRLEHIFSEKQTHDYKKYISSSLSPLEQRLVYYEQYYNSSLEADDIQLFKASLQVNMNHPTRYVPFRFSELFTKLHNYSVAIFSISEILYRVLVNPLFNNVVYLPLEKSTKEDPYSFYSLESITDDGKRNWKLQCRLDEFSKIISQDIKSYCIDIFRKIYFDIFHNNIYRDNYSDSFPITSQDCAQLLENIIFLSKQKSLCIHLRNIIIEKCTLKPSTNDKFDFKADDKVIKRTFALDKDEPKEIEDSIKRLFDSIKSDQIEKIISNININSC